MHILFDARCIQHQSDGLSNYVRHLLGALLRFDTDNYYWVLLSPFVRDELSKAGLLEHPRLHIIVTQIPFMGPLQQIGIPLLVRRLPPMDVYHYPHFDLPLFAHDHSVITIYDLNHICMRGYFDRLRGLKRAYSLATTQLSLRRARHVITISCASKAALLERFSWLCPDMISVTYFGLSELFQTAPATERVTEFRRRFNLGDDRFALYVGTDRAHKNLDRLIRAYAKVRRQGSFPHKLLLAGSFSGNGRFSRTVEDLGLKDAVRHLGYVSDDDLPLAYRVADVFAFCSLSEGFGLPLIEAMACGVPVVTSNIGAMAEVTADCGVVVNPLSVDDIAQGLCSVLSSATLRQQLVVKGLERIRGFTWEQTASKTLEVYRRICGTGSSQANHPAM